MFSQILGLEAWNSAEFMHVRSMRSNATAREAGPLRGKAIFPFPSFDFQVRFYTIAIGTGGVAN